MERENPTYAAELDANRRRRLAQRRKQVRRVRAVLALVGLLVIIGVVAGVWAISLMNGPSYERARKVPFPSPVDLVAPSILYAKEYADTLGPPPPEPLSPAPGIRTIVLDRSERHVTLYKSDGTPVDRFKCSIGQTYPRVGTYKVTSKKESSSYPADGTRFYHFVIFTKSDKNTNIGFHSIPIDKEGIPVGTLGQSDTHGCVRLENENAEFLYKWAPIGAKVIVRK